MDIKKCPKCNSDECVPIPSNWLSSDASLPLWHCNDCGHQWGKDAEEVNAANDIEKILREYLENHPDDKTRLMSIINEYGDHIE